MEPDRIRAHEFSTDLEWFNVDKPLTLADLRGKMVILNFWTYSCINCIHALPDLAWLEKEYPDTLAIIGVHSPKFKNEHAPKRLQKAINRYSITYPVVNDDKFEMWQAYAIKAWPSLVLIDPEGYVISIFRGEGRRQSLDELIQKHLAEAGKKALLKPSLLPVKIKPEVSQILHFPGKVIADPNQLYIADSGHHRILETSHDGKIKRVFGNGKAGMLDGAETRAKFNNPQGMTLLGDFLYIADTGNHAIRRIHLISGEVMTVAGNGKQGRYVAERFTDPHEAELNSPWDLSIFEKNLYIAMAGQHQIWRMNLNHLAIERYAGVGRKDINDGAALQEATFAQPSGLAVLGKTLYVVDAETSAIRSIDLAVDEVNTIVGTGLFDFGDRDGIGARARLQHPLGIAADQGSNALWIADTYNSKIKRIDINTNELTKFPINFPLDEPGGISLYRHKLFIANTNAHQIVILDLQSNFAGVVSVRE